MPVASILLYVKWMSELPRLGKEARNRDKPEHYIIIESICCVRIGRRIDGIHDIGSD